MSTYKENIKSFRVEIPDKQYKPVKDRALLHESIAVYAITGTQEEIIYIGKTINLRSRAYQHFSGHLTNIKDKREVSGIYFWSCGDEIQSSMLEIFLINENRPKYNKEFMNVRESDVPAKDIENVVKNECVYGSMWELSQFKNKKEMNEAVSRSRTYYKDVLNPTQEMIIDVLSAYSVKIPGVSTLKHETIQEVMVERGRNVSKQTVRRVLRRLNELGIITTHRTIRPRSGGSGANMYVINKCYSTNRFWDEASA